MDNRVGPLTGPDKLIRGLKEPRWNSLDLTFMGPCIIMYSFKYNQQDTRLYNILYYCQCSTCFRRFLRPSSGAQKLYSSNSPTLAVTASKLGIYPMLCVQFLNSLWGAEKPPETYRALTIIKNIVQRCILLVVLKRVIFFRISKRVIQRLLMERCRVLCHIFVIHLDTKCSVRVTNWNNCSRESRETLRPIACQTLVSRFSPDYLVVTSVKLHSKFQFVVVSIWLYTWHSLSCTRRLK